MGDRLPGALKKQFKFNTNKLFTESCKSEGNIVDHVISHKGQKIIEWIFLGMSCSFA